MNNKYVAKKYIIAVSIMMVAFFGITMLLMYLLNLGGSLLKPTAIEAILISLGSAYLPCASFTGFCICFLPAREMSKTKMILIVVFFPLVLAFITMIGIIMLIPTYIKEIIILTKNASRND